MERYILEEKYKEKSIIRNYYKVSYVSSNDCRDIQETSRKEYHQNVYLKYAILISTD